MTWTDYDDVASRWIGGGFPTDEGQVTTLIEDAEDTVLRAFPTIQTRIDDGTLPEARVRKVVARMVMRHLRNPTGMRSTQQGAGPFQQTTTFGGDEPGTLYLTDADRSELAGPTSNTGKAFAVDITPATANTVPDDWFWEPLV